MPQPRPPPPAWAWVVVEARPPVKASAASARAAILVLIDMRNSIRLWADRCGPCAQLDGPCSIPVRFALGEIAGSAILDSDCNDLAAGALGPRAGRKRVRIEFIDIGEQFAERARAVIEQAFAFLRGGHRRIACGAACVKVLGLPGQRRRPVR